MTEFDVHTESFNSSQIPLTGIYLELYKISINI